MITQVKIHTKSELLQFLHENREEIKAYGVNSLGIFGSFCRGPNSETSDVDLYLDFDPSQKSFDNFMDPSFFLEELVGRKVEIITPQSLSKFIGPHILNEVQHVFS